MALYISFDTFSIEDPPQYKHKNLKQNSIEVNDTKIQTKKKKVPAKPLIYYQ